MQLSTGLNISDVETGLVATRAVTNDTISLTFKLSFNVTNLTSARQTIIHDSLLTWLNESSTLGNFTLVTNETGYQGFMISGRLCICIVGCIFGSEMKGSNVM